MFELQEALRGYPCQNNVDCLIIIIERTTLQYFKDSLVISGSTLRPYMKESIVFMQCNNT